MIFDSVVSSTYFNILNMLGTDKSSIMRRKSPGPNLVPWSTPHGTFPHSDKQSLLSWTLWDLSEEVDNPIDAIIKNLNLFQFRD